MVYHCFTGVGIWASLGKIQHQAIRYVPYDFVAPGATKSHTPLDNIVSLGNRIAYDFGRDRTTAQLQLPNVTPQLWHDVKHVKGKSTNRMAEPADHL